MYHFYILLGVRFLLCVVLPWLCATVFFVIKKNTGIFPVLYLYTIKFISVTRLSFLANSTQLTL